MSEADRRNTVCCANCRYWRPKTPVAEVCTCWVAVPFWVNRLIVTNSTADSDGKSCELFSYLPDDNA